MSLFNKFKKNTSVNYLFNFPLISGSEYENFKINIDTQCLVLSQYPGAEIRGLGGIIAQFPKNFEVLCLTNGSNMIYNADPVKAAGIKKAQFTEVMKTLRVKGYKIFNIDSGCLKNNYSTFKKIDVSEADYIFVPNIYDRNPDSLYLLKHFKELVNTKEHKETLKIIMFESDSPLSAPNYISNISNIIETKKKMLDLYNEPSNKVIALNAFRSAGYNCEYCETYMSFGLSEFLDINLL